MNWLDFGTGFWLGWIVGMAIEILARHRKRIDEREP